MKDTITLTYENIDDSLVIFRYQFKEKEEYYLAMKIGPIQYLPLIEASTKEECLKKGIKNMYYKNQKFVEIFENLLAATNGLDMDDFALSEEFYVCKSDDCRFRYFVIENGNVDLSRTKCK